MDLKPPRELASHEKDLFLSGNLEERTHEKSTSRWFYGIIGNQTVPPGNKQTENEEMVYLYRHMGDVELDFLVENNQLPDTQPYQTIVEGESGFQYCMKYFTGAKSVDTNVVTIIEFYCPKTLTKSLFDTFHKAEDGCLSTGLGNKAGKTLKIFNQALQENRISWTPVFVKRPKRLKTK